MGAFVTATTLLLRQWPLALAYGLLVTLSLTLTRFEGGVAFLWGGTAVLMAALMRTSRRHWWAPLLVCFAINLLLTGVLGLGWWAALPFALINQAEAVLAAGWMRRHRGSREVMADLAWFGRFVIACCLAPLLLAPLVGFLLAALGSDPQAAMLRFVTGHALGNLALAPLALMLTGRIAWRETQAMLTERRVQLLLILPLVAAVVFGVFVQTRWPLLFLPALAIVLATFRLGRLGAALSLVLLIGIGGIATALGRGPIVLADATFGDRMQFFQLYLAVTVLTLLPIAADLHRRRILHQQLKRSEAEFRLLADYSTDMIARIAADGRVTYMSPACLAITGYRTEQLLGSGSRTIIDPRDLAFVRAEQKATLEQRGVPRSYEYRITTAGGERRWLATHARALLDEVGEPRELLAVIRDVTEGRSRHKEWERAALSDPLTGLANRRALELKVDRRCGQGTGQRDCLALLDLDRFKRINDTHGHNIGDMVLQRFSKLALKLVRSDDMLARIGGEEFVILFEDTTVERALQVCERMREVLARTPLETPAGPITLTVSGGVAPIGGEGLNAALKAADAALYRAKRAGRDQMLRAA